MSFSITQFSTKSTNVIIYSLISIILAILAIFVFIVILALTGNPIVLTGLLQNILIVFFTNPTAFANIFYSAIPLIFTGLAVAVAFQAGLFNIGGQGQMVLGGVYTAAWATVIINNIYNSTQFNFLLTPIFLIPTCLLVGAICGGFWGFIPGVLKAKTGAHEVITTIMMNQIAASLVRYLVGSVSYSPYISKDALAYGQSDPIAKGARFPPIFPKISDFLNWGILVALFIIVIVQFIIYKTNFGYKLRAVGHNPEAAEAVGINSERMVIYAMTLSGAIAGIGGSVYLMGTFPYRYFLDYEGTLGFDGIAVSLIGLNSPIGIALAAIFFGYLNQTRAQLDKTAIPPDMVFVFQAWVIIFAVAPVLSKMIYERMKRLARENLQGRSDENDSSEKEQPMISEEGGMEK